MLHALPVHAQVSRGAPPPLPGGYVVGENVFYTGDSVAFDDGDELVHGQQGVVTGPIGPGSGHEGNGVCVRFPDNTDDFGCLLTEVRRLRAASAATPSSCAPHTRRCPRPVRTRDSLSAAAPQPSLHAQSLAPQPTARGREGWWPRA